MYVSLVLTDKECENLCMRAEDLMQRSVTQEKYGDLAGALIHCDQAIGNFFNLMGLYRDLLLYIIIMEIRQHIKWYYLTLHTILF